MGNRVNFNTIWRGADRNSRTTFVAHDPVDRKLLDRARVIRWGEGTEERNGGRDEKERQRGCAYDVGHVGETQRDIRRAHNPRLDRRSSSSRAFHLPPLRANRIYLRL